VSALLWLLLPRDRLEFHFFFVHDGDGFLLLALLFVDCRFSANLLRRKTRKSCAAQITLLKMVWKRK
jgi:hypothetical protein